MVNPIHDTFACIVMSSTPAVTPGECARNRELLTISQIPISCSRVLHLLFLLSRYSSTLPPHIVLLSSVRLNFTYDSLWDPRRQGEAPLFCHPRGPCVYLLVSIPTLCRNGLWSSPADCELLKGIHLSAPTTETGILVQSNFFFYLLFIY